MTKQSSSENRQILDCSGRAKRRRSFSTVPGTSESGVPRKLSGLSPLSKTLCARHPPSSIFHSRVFIIGQPSLCAAFHRPARRRRADDQWPVFPHRRILERHHRRANARRAAAHDHLQLSTLNRDHLMALFGNELYFAAELRLEHGELDKHRVVDNDQRHDRKRYHQSVNGEFVFPA